MSSHSDDEHAGACSITQVRAASRSRRRCCATCAGRPHCGTAHFVALRLSHFTSSVDFTSSAAVCHRLWPAAARPVRLSAEQQRAAAAALHTALSCELMCVSAVHVLPQGWQCLRARQRQRARVLRGELRAHAHTTVNHSRSLAAQRCSLCAAAFRPVADALDLNLA